MRPVSDRFLDTIRGSHIAVFKATVCTTFQTGTNPTGTEIPVNGGNVKSTAGGLVRSTLELATTVHWPRVATDLVTPYGHEIHIARGVQYGNGQRELVPLGYYRIDTPEQDETPDGEVLIAAQDRMSGIVDGRFLAPRQFARH